MILKINPAWIAHPYEVSYLFGLGQVRQEWSRKRRLKMIRRWRKRVLPNRHLVDVMFAAEAGPERSDRIAPLIFKRSEWRGEISPA